VSETMLAVRNHGPRDYRLERAPMPKAGPGEAVIKIDAAGICGSDGKCYGGAEMFKSWVKLPVIPGHEFFGTVMELGEGAGAKWGIARGDKVIAEQIYPCDRCRFCQRGQYWMCEVHDMYGFQKEIADGSWAEYMKFGTRSRVHKMPADIKREAGVLVEPLACAMHAVERGEIQLGDTVVLAGAGTLGLLMLQIIKLKNPGLIIVADAKDERLEIARSLGAHVTINVKTQDVVAEVKKLTGGYGTDVFIEASGYAGAVAQGLDMIRKLGTFVSFGVFGEKATADWSIIGDRKELNIHGAHLGPYCYPRAIDYLHRGIVKWEPIVTTRMPLADFQKGVDQLLAGKGIKIMLEP